MLQNYATRFNFSEELIAQAQVVLQGKSREAIVRELQRTNLNVNEAVNNLLSRDDDEGWHLELCIYLLCMRIFFCFLVDDLDEAGDYLHEELLSLLDAGLRADGTAAVLDSDALYNAGEGFEYMLTGESRKRDGTSGILIGRAISSICFRFKVKRAKIRVNKRRCHTRKFHLR